MALSGRSLSSPVSKMVSAFLYSETFGMAVEGLQHERCPSGMTLKKKLFKTGARIVQHAPYVTFQMVQLDIPRRR